LKIAISCTSFFAKFKQQFFNLIGTYTSSCWALFHTRGLCHSCVFLENWKDGKRKKGYCLLVTYL